MKTTIRNMRLYFWPIVTWNVLAMTIAVRGDTRRSALFSLVISLLASFGFLLNDLCDRDVDRINKPGRFETSNSNTIRVGIAASIGCLIAAIGLALSLGSREYQIACVLAAGLTLYSVFLRPRLIVPTVFAGLLAASPLWAPLILWPRNVHALHWILVVAMTLLLAAREILMDVRDRAGDKAGARETIATEFGARFAASASLALVASGGLLLGIVLMVRSANLAASHSIAATIAVFVVLGVTLAPAFGVTRAASESREERQAIKEFVLWSRAGMVVLPFLNFFLWR